MHRWCPLFVIEWYLWVNKVSAVIEAMATNREREWGKGRDLSVVLERFHEYWNASCRNEHTNALDNHVLTWAHTFNQPTIGHRIGTWCGRHERCSSHEWPYPVSGLSYTTIWQIDQDIYLCDMRSQLPCSRLGISFVCRPHVDSNFWLTLSTGRCDVNELNSLIAISSHCPWYCVCITLARCRRETRAHAISNRAWSWG